MVATGLEDIVQKSIFELTDLNHLDDEVKSELFQKAYETIMNRVMLRVADQLDEAGLDQLKELISKGEPEAVHHFFTQHQIDIDQIASTETLAYKVEMHSLTETLRRDQPAR